MPWQLTGLFLAAIWPPAIDDYKQITVAPADISVQAEVWKEYGFVEGETAQYENGPRKLTVTAWRFQESTGPMAAYFWQAPPQGTPIPLMKHALAAKGVTLAAVGNYLMRFEGTYRPSASELNFWVEHFPGYRNRSLPALPLYLPDGAVSKRYIMGPHSLKAFLSEVPEQAVGFHFGTEILASYYPTASGRVRVAVAQYPNHQIARQQLKPFQQFAGENARRSGALVVVALPPVPADASTILDKIKYDTIVEFTDTEPTKMPNVGGLLIGSFRLVGFLMLVGLGSGAVVALLILFGRTRESRLEVMTRLRID
jgi:hypothetical protein